MSLVRWALAWPRFDARCGSADHAQRIRRLAHEHLNAIHRTAHRLGVPPADIELRRRVLARLSEPEARPSERFAGQLLRPPALVLWLGALVLGLLAVGPWLLRPRSASREPSAVALGPEPRVPEESGSAAPALGARRRCPSFEVPSGAFIAPDSSRGMDSVGVKLHSFDMATPPCENLRRRFLFSVPPGLEPRTRAPVLIVLHDRGQSAEAMHVEQTYWHFEELARRAGLVLVYANAAPGPGTNVKVPNSGGWQTDPDAHPQVDDQEYLRLIMRELRTRGVVAGENDLYLLGVGSGADMALTAAARQPNVYAGVAAFYPRAAGNVEPPRPSQRGRLSRVLFVERRTRDEDWLDQRVQAVANRWALGVGLPQPLLRSMRVDALPPAPEKGRRKSEATPASTIQRWDIASHASAGPGVRVLVLEQRAGLLPVQPGAPGAFDGAREAWAFLSGADGIAPRPAAAAEGTSALDEQLIDGEIPPPPLFLSEELVQPDAQSGKSPRSR